MRATASSRQPAAGSLHVCVAVLLGTAMTLTLRGYQFGQSNHAVYLVDALRRIDPQLLARDWWTTSTLQYHFAFTHLSELLLRLNVIEPAFLIGYLALAVLLHVGWLKLTFAVGGTWQAYLLSVLLYYLSAAGLGLGVYHFLQDSSFLPSNVSNVAMLWGMYFWLGRRWGLSGLCLGVAGLFHLNYAIVGIGMWMVLGAWHWYSWHGLSARAAWAASPFHAHSWLLGGAALMGLSVFSIAPAVGVILQRSEALPLAEFVSLYVTLRHPHHYNPLSWGGGLWLSFLWVMPIGVIGWRLLAAEAAGPVREAVRIMVLLTALLLMALLFAGVWFVSESLVQMSLWRFSIYLKLLMCIGAAGLLVRYPRLLLTGAAAMAGVAILLPVLAWNWAFIGLNLVPILLFLVLAGLSVLLMVAKARAWAVAAVAAAIVAGAMWNSLGLRLSLPLDDGPEYLAMCQWVRENTPRQALLLVPPDEQSMRLHGRRAIVVNFKNVPQLSGELPEWRDRLRQVLGMDELSQLPGPFHVTLAAMRQRYDELPAEHLLAVAQAYAATHVVTTRPLEALPPVYTDPAGRYYLYELLENP